VPPNGRSPSHVRSWHSADIDSRDIDVRLGVLTGPGCLPSLEQPMTQSEPNLPIKRRR
jgi:hypothetical protein